MNYKYLALAFIAFSAFGCGPWNKAPTNEGLAYFEVTFTDGTNIGTIDNPVEKADIYTFYVNIAAMDYNKELMSDYNGKVEIKPLAATLESYSRVTLTNGRYDNLEVKLRYAADEEVISVHEVEEVQEEFSTSYRPTGKVGVSPTIYLPHISIQQIQGTHNNNASNGFLSRFDRRNLTIGQWMVVTAVLEGGFYVHQLGAEEFGGMYVYSHSTPFVDDGNDIKALEVGTILEELNASVQEFFGFTEMSFPTYTLARTPEGRPLIDESRIPEIKDITQFVISGNNVEIEKYEAELVKIDSGIDGRTDIDIVIDDFDEHEQSYIDYSQYPLMVNGNPIMTSTLSTAPTFNPVANKGQKVKSLTGILKQHRASRPSTWIIVPRDIKDIELAK